MEPKNMQPKYYQISVNSRGNLIDACTVMYNFTVHAVYSTLFY